MHQGFLNIVFKKCLLAMVGEIYYGEVFINVSDRSILQKRDFDFFSLLLDH